MPIMTPSPAAYREWQIVGSFDLPATGRVDQPQVHHSTAITTMFNDARTVTTVVDTEDVEWATFTLLDDDGIAQYWGLALLDDDDPWRLEAWGWGLVPGWRPYYENGNHALLTGSVFFLKE